MLTGQKPILRERAGTTTTTHLKKKPHYFIKSALLTAGLLTIPLFFPAKAQNLPTKREAIVAANTARENASNKKAPSTYDASKSFGTANTEILELVPSTMTPNVGSKTITVKTHTILNNGKVNKSDGVPYTVTVDDDTWGALGASKFDGTEIETVVKIENGYSHYYINKKWNTILIIGEPIMTEKTGPGNVTMECSTLRLESKPYKPLTYWKTENAFLIFTETGFVGKINGTGGEITLTSVFGISKIVEPRFIVKTTKNGKSLLLEIGNANKYVEFPMDENGQITLKMNFKEAQVTK